MIDSPGNEFSGRYQRREGTQPDQIKPRQNGHERSDLAKRATLCQSARMNVRIGIIGATGRMGRAIAEEAVAQGVAIAGGINRAGAILGEHGDAPSLAQAADVLIDFSSPQMLRQGLAAAQATRTPILIGTTGLGPEDHKLIATAARDVPVLQTANTSLGVNVLAKLVEQAARALGTDWDIEIVEMHHRHKVDAPSGTALLLGEAAAAGRGVPLAEVKVADRAGLTGARAEGTIGFASLRGGSVAGDHQVIFAGTGERIEIGHRAEDRAIFAKGAITAALWLADKPAGRYQMGDVLGL